MAEPQRERKRRKWDVAAPVPSSAASGPNAGLQPGSATHVTASVSTALLSNAQDANSGAKPAAPSAPTADIIARAKMGAMSVLEKINKDLRTKGTAPMKSFGPKIDEDRIRRDVVINDAPAPIRYNLTRRVTQDDIARRTGTQIVVRGQYQPPGVPVTTDESPLFLKVTPGAVSQEEDSVQQYAVDVAAGEVQHIVNGGAVGTYRHNVPPPASVTGATAQSQQPPLGQHTPGMAYQAAQRGPAAGSYPPVQAGGQVHGNYQQAKPSYASVAPPGNVYPQQVPAVPLYINFNAPPDFDLPGRLRGPGDSFLGHIAGKTGTQVVLRGSRSGMVETPEPLHILVTGNSQQSIDEAVRLAKNLIDTVQEDSQKRQSYGPSVQSQLQQPMYSQPPPAGPAVNPYAAQPSGHTSYPRHPPNFHPQPGPHMSAAQSFGYGAHGGQQAPHYALPQQPGQIYPPAGRPYMQPNTPQAYMHARPAPYSQQWPGASHPPPSNAALPTANSNAGYQGLHQAQHAQGGPSYRQDVAQQPSSVSNEGSHAALKQDRQRSDSAQGSEEGGAGQKEPPKEGRRRFKEFKEAQPAVPSQPAPYAPAPPDPPAPSTTALMGPPAPKEKEPASMGPPPPKAPSSMGPPPPRNPTSMGPPPPRPALRQGPGHANETSISGSLAGLVDYD